MWKCVFYHIKNVQGYSSVKIWFWVLCRSFFSTHFGVINHIFRKCTQLINGLSQLIFEKWIYLLNHNADQICTSLVPQKLPSCCFPVIIIPKANYAYDILTYINFACLKIYTNGVIISKDLNIFPKCYICDIHQCCDSKSIAVASHLFSMGCFQLKLLWTISYVLILHVFDYISAGYNFLFQF